MSTFGDGTPQQDMLEWVVLVKDEYQLTKEELVTVLISILQYLNDPHDSILNETRKKHKD